MEKSKVLNSTRKCPTQLVEDLGGCLEAQTLPWSVVQTILNKVHILFCQFCKVGALRDVTPHKPDGVLNSSLLPAVVGCTKVRTRPQHLIHQLMLCVL